MSRLLYTIDGHSYSKGNRTSLTLIPEALNPYGRKEYRVIRCYKIYRKGLPSLYAFTVLSYNNRLHCVKVYESDNTIKVFKAVRNCLRLKTPAVVTFETIEAVTYALPRGSVGISLYTHSCEYVEKLPKELTFLPYYTGEIVETKED